MGLAESYAWAAASNQTSVDGVEKCEEGTGPAVRTSCWLGNSLWLVQCVLESVDPSVDIISIDSSRYGVLLRSGHFVRCEIYMWMKE